MKIMNKEINVTRYINQYGIQIQGDWKIGGLGFGIFLNQGDGANSYFEYNEYLPDECQINLDYAGNIHYKKNKSILLI